MTGLLNFHRLAAMRGDGLHPKLLELIEQREALAGGNPKLVDLGALRDSGVTQAGPGPQPRPDGFLPGNIVDFSRRSAAKAQAEKKTSSL